MIDSMTVTSLFDSAATVLRSAFVSLPQDGAGAADAAGDAGAAPAGGMRTIGEFLESGGELMIPLGICSVLVLGFFLERTLALRRGRVCPKRLREPIDALGRGELDAASAALDGEKSPAGRILVAGLRRRSYPLRDVESAMEDQSHKELERLRQNVRPLVVIGAVAPLLGLLGTVLGIARSFRRVSETGMGDAEALAGGIELALTTTIVGLAVAIPAILASSWLQGRVRKLIMYADEQVAPVVEKIAAPPPQIASTLAPSQQVVLPVAAANGKPSPAEEVVTAAGAAEEGDAHAARTR